MVAGDSDGRVAVRLVLHVLIARDHDTLDAIKLPRLSQEMCWSALPVRVEVGEPVEGMAEISHRDVCGGLDASHDDVASSVVGRVLSSSASVSEGSEEGLVGL